MLEKESNSGLRRPATGESSIDSLGVSNRNHAAMAIHELGARYLDEGWSNWVILARGAAHG